jgi:hypothetical protein
LHAQIYVERKDGLGSANIWGKFTGVVGAFFLFFSLKQVLGV